MQNNEHMLGDDQVTMISAHIQDIHLQKPMLGLQILDEFAYIHVEGPK